RSVRVESFLDHEIDVPKVDKPQIDGDFFGICRLWPEIAYVIRHLALHPRTIHGDGIGMEIRPFKVGFTERCQPWRVTSAGSFRTRTFADVPGQPEHNPESTVVRGRTRPNSRSGLLWTKSGLSIHHLP